MSTKNLFDSGSFDDLQLTDTDPTYTVQVKTESVTDLFVDVISDKGATLFITPLVSDIDDLEGAESESTTIDTGGGSVRAKYSSIAANKALITVTKTESGDTTTFRLIVRGGS